MITLKIRRPTLRYYRNKSPRSHGISMNLVPISAVLLWSWSPSLQCYCQLCPHYRGYCGKTVIPIPVQLSTGCPSCRPTNSGKKDIRPLKNLKTNSIKALLNKPLHRHDHKYAHCPSYWHYKINASFNQQTIAVQWNRTTHLVCCITSGPSIHH